jgi:membrane-associated protein
VWTIGLVLLGHALGHVGFVRNHVDVLVVVVVLLSVLPVLFEITRRHRRARNAGA